MLNKRLRKEANGLTVMEAVDNLSSMAELDISASPTEIDKDLASTYHEKAPLARGNWDDASHLVENREVVKETFRVIHNYLVHIYEREKGELKDPELQRGIRAIMVLAGEAAQKLDRYTSLFKDAMPNEKIVQLKEYQELQNFYLTRVVKRFSKGQEGGQRGEEPWKKEWQEAKADEPINIERTSLKDLETVRKDKEYELFYIRKQNGESYFNSNLLRHIRLVGEFDESLSNQEGEDPLLKIKLIEDHDVYVSAKEILEQVSHQ